MANLLDMLKDQIGDSVFSSAGQYLGADASGVKSAMGAAMPAVLGSMISKSASPSGASGLMDMITGGGHDGSIFGNLGGLFGGGDTTTSFMNSGSGILKSLMGNKLGGVVDMISNISGMKKGLSSSVLSMAAPFVMGAVGRWVKNKALDAVGLGKFLGSQSKHVASALPSGMGSLLGFGSGMGNKVEAAADTARETVSTAASGGSSILTRVLPLLLVLGLGYFAWNQWGGAVTDKVKDGAGAITEGAKNVGGKAMDGVKAAGDAVVDGAKTVGGAVADGAGAVWDGAKSLGAGAIEAGKKALDGVEFAAGSVGEKFSTWLGEGGSAEGNNFQFNNLTFDTGSAAIKDMAEVDNLANVLKAYSSVKIEVMGHTDSSGNADSNMALSQKRAESVRNQLIAQGIDGARITTKGYGSTMPKVGTDAADAANKRVEIKVTGM